MERRRGKGRPVDAAFSILALLLKCVICRLKGAGMVKLTGSSLRVAEGADGPALLGVPDTESQKTALSLEGFGVADFVRLYRAAPLERINIARRGVPASQAKRIMGDLAMSAAATSKALNIPVSTINRKAKTQGVLGRDESERVIGLARLIGQVQAMVEESGDPEGFDAQAWTARWLNAPLPALGGEKPSSLMDTMEGQQLVSDILARAQSGAYS